MRVLEDEISSLSQSNSDEQAQLAVLRRDIKLMEEKIEEQDEEIVGLEAASNAANASLDLLRAKLLNRLISVGIFQNMSEPSADDLDAFIVKHLTIGVDGPIYDALREALAGLDQN